MPHSPLFDRVARRVYGRMPSSLQERMAAVESRRVAAFRFAGDYQQIYSAACRRLELSRDRFGVFRDARLQALLCHAHNSVPYAQELAWERSWQLDEATISVDDLPAFGPIVDKAHLKANVDRFVSSRPNTSTHIVRTGGTTGDPLAFPTTRAAVQEQWAVWWRFRALHGLTPSVLCGHFGGQAVVPPHVDRPPFWRHHKALHRVYFSPLHLSPDTAAEYVEELRRRGITWLHGYPTVLRALATFVLDQGLSLDPPIQWVTTGAEALSDDDRDLIGRAFGAPVFQHYGMAEAVANVSECPRGVLHVDEDFAAVEFVMGPTPGLFRVIGTALSNYATLFLRYDTLDLARVPGPACGCGHPGRTIAGVEGRLSDFVQLATGELVGPVNQIAKGLSGLRHLQLVHHGDESITALVVPRGVFSKELRDQVVAAIQARSHSSLTIDVEAIEQPARSAAGKAVSVIRDPS